MKIAEINNFEVYAVKSNLRVLDFSWLIFLIANLVWVVLSVHTTSWYLLMTLGVIPPLFFMQMFFITLFKKIDFKFVPIDHQ